MSTSKQIASEVMSPEPQLAAGDSVGEYIVETKIGEGAFGSVYRGIQPTIGKQVAIKVLSRKYSADPNIVSRFVAEARAVNQIRHRNIIDIFSFGQLEDGRHYHVMELLEGATLEEHLRRQAGLLPLPEALLILRGLAKALDAAHQCGIAHRDLKPANVFLSREDDGKPFPKLLDFGIAKLLSDEMPRHHQTATGAAVGTPDYMSPEQCQGPDVDHRTDVYAFGILVYQIFTGRLPFTGESVVEVMMKQMKEPAKAPSNYASHLSAEIDQVILKMLAKKKDERPDSLIEAIVSLEDAVKAAGLEVPQSPITQDPQARTPLLAPSQPSMAGSPSDSQAALAATFLSDAEGDAPEAKSTGGRQNTWLLVALALMVAGILWAGLNVSPTEAEPPKEPIVATPEPESAKGVKVPPAPEKTALYISGEPVGAKVLGGGGVLLGTIPGSFEFARDLKEVSLKFEFSGYRGEQRLVSVAASGTISVSLKKVTEVSKKRKKLRRQTKSKKTVPKNKDSLEEPSWTE